MGPGVQRVQVYFDAFITIDTHIHTHTAHAHTHTNTRSAEVGGKAGACGGHA